MDDGITTTASELYEDGYLRATGAVDGDVRTGHWTFWYETGEKQGEGLFVDGKRSGVWSYYHRNGRLANQCLYKEGRRHGQWRSWYPEGPPFEFGQYVLGLREGFWTEWWPSGTLKSKTEFRAGGRHGEYTLWREDGSKEVLAKTREGLFHGPYTVLSKRGDVVEHGEMVGGVREGSWIVDSSLRLHFRGGLLVPESGRLPFQPDSMKGAYYPYVPGQLDPPCTPFEYRELGGALYFVRIENRLTYLMSPTHGFLLRPFFGFLLLGDWRNVQLDLYERRYALSPKGERFAGPGAEATSRPAVTLAPPAAPSFTVFPEAFVGTGDLLERVRTFADEAAALDEAASWARELECVTVVAAHLDSFFRG